MRAPVPATTPLDPGAVYLSPSGRRCRWLSTTQTAPGRVQAVLLYDLAHGGRATTRGGDGFVLDQANWHLLRRVG